MVFLRSVGCRDGFPHPADGSFLGGLSTKRITEAEECKGSCGAAGTEFGTRSAPCWPRFLSAQKLISEASG